jgi:hypothetical protein
LVNASPTRSGVRSALRHRGVSGSTTLIEPLAAQFLEPVGNPID